MLMSKHLFDELSLDDDEGVDRLRRALAGLARSLRASDSASGLTPTQASILFTVVRAGQVGLSDLSRVEGLNPTMLSRAIGGLEEAGLVRREADPADRRAASVGATPSGRRLLRRLRTDRSNVLRAQLSHLSEDERQRLSDALPVLEVLSARLRDERTAAQR
jgi:DNA-binding MarR family transcriptional regulator